MIQKLSIQNFAIIDDITIDFNKGFSVLTGQTGSGKSILLDALNLIFGSRAHYDMIRHGKDRAIVSAQFLISDELSSKLLIPTEILIEREVERNGRNQIKVNGQVQTLSYVREITNEVGLIHGQDEQYLLLDKNNYLSLLDQVSPKQINILLNDYLIKRENYLAQITKIKKLEQSNQKKEERLDYLVFQKEELEKISLKLGEEDELKNEAHRLKHFEKLSSSLYRINQLISEEPGIGHLFEVVGELSTVKDILPNYDEIHTSVESAYYELIELTSMVNSDINNLSYDQKEFDDIQNRLYEINRLCVKYNKTGDELVNLLAEINEEINLTTNFDSYIKELKEESIKLKEIALISAKKLSKYRVEIANAFSKEVISLLQKLDLPDVLFEVEFNESNELLSSGIDLIDFLISFNKNEPLKPLARIASGGEKARFMFAFKAVLAQELGMSLLILDEIDIGISGKTASKMAQQMQNLAKKLQLIVITHLPQVASKADYQYLINKKTDNNRVNTTIDLLSESERIVQIATMISDDQVTSFALEQAKVMLDTK